MHLVSMYLVSMYLVSMYLVSMYLVSMHQVCCIVYWYELVDIKFWIQNDVLATSSTSQHCPMNMPY